MSGRTSAQSGVTLVEILIGLGVALLLALAFWGPSLIGGGGGGETVSDIWLLSHEWTQGPEEVTVGEDYTFEYRLQRHHPLPAKVQFEDLVGYDVEISGSSAEVEIVSVNGTLVTGPSATVATGPGGRITVVARVGGLPSPAEGTVMAFPVGARSIDSRRSFFRVVP